MQAFLRFMGHGFCHQIPSRCFESGGLVFSVCARDTGIYLGFFFTLLVMFIIHARVKIKPGDLPSWRYLIVLALFVVPLAFDGLSSYLGIRSTTNVIRYLTGLPTGIAAGTVITPLLFVLRKDADPKKKILSKPSTFVIQLIATLVLGLAFLFGYPYLGVVSPFLVVVAFLTIVVSINLILFTLSKRFYPRHTWKHWLLLLALCLVLAFVEIAVFGELRDLMVLTVMGGHDFSYFMQ